MSRIQSVESHISYARVVAKRRWYGRFVGSFFTAVLVLAWPPICGASIVYSSFLPGGSYFTSGPFGVEGPDSDIANFTGLGLTEAAGAFTPTDNYTLTQIDVAVVFAVGFHGFGVDTGGFNLSLNQDSGGTPGAAIESWTGLDAPTVSSGTSASIVDTVLSVSAASMLAGNQYWIVASPADSTTYDFWEVNDATGSSGIGGVFALGKAAGWGIIDNNAPYALAFDVQGVADTPEPGTANALVIGLLGIGCCLRRQGGRNQLTRIPRNPKL